MLIRYAHLGYSYEHAEEYYPDYRMRCDKCNAQPARTWYSLWSVKEWAQRNSWMIGKYHPFYGHDSLCPECSCTKLVNERSRS